MHLDIKYHWKSHVLSRTVLFKGHVVRSCIVKVSVLSCDLDSYPSTSSGNGLSYNVEIHGKHLDVFFSTSHSRSDSKQSRQSVADTAHMLLKALMHWELSDSPGRHVALLLALLWEPLFEDVRRWDDTCFQISRILQLWEHEPGLGGHTCGARNEFFFRKQRSAKISLLLQPGRL